MESTKSLALILLGFTIHCSTGFAQIVSPYSTKAFAAYDSPIDPVNQIIPVKLANIDQIITDQKPKSPTELLKLIKLRWPRYLDFFSLVYKSRSLQSATPMEPRLLLVAPNGTSLSFAGPNQFRSNVVEAFEYDDEKKKFHFREYKFQGKRARILNSPKSCMLCHGNFPKPIWDSYPLWPGVYGSTDDYHFKYPKNTETKNLEKFLAEIAPNTEPYKTLGVSAASFKSHRPSRREYDPNLHYIYSQNRRNLNITNIFSNLVGKTFLEPIFDAFGEEFRFQSLPINELDPTVLNQSILSELYKKKDRQFELNPEDKETYQDKIIEDDDRGLDIRSGEYSFAYRLSSEDINSTTVVQYQALAN